MPARTTCSSDCVCMATGVFLFPLFSVTLSKQPLPSVPDAVHNSIVISFVGILEAWQRLLAAVIVMTILKLIIAMAVCLYTKLQAASIAVCLLSVCLSGMGSAPRYWYETAAGQYMRVRACVCACVCACLCTCACVCLWIKKREKQQENNGDLITNMIAGLLLV